MFPLSPRNTGSADPAHSIMLSCLMGIWKHSSRYWHQPSGWLISMLLTIMASTSQKMRGRSLYPSLSWGFLLSPKNQYNISWSQRGKHYLGSKCLPKREQMWTFLVGAEGKPSALNFKTKLQNRAILCTHRKRATWAIALFSLVQTRWLQLHPPNSICLLTWQRDQSLDFPWLEELIILARL